MEPGSNQLLRVLGVVFGLAAVVGSVIGQGILRSPGVVADATGSEAIIIGMWVLGCVIALINATSWAELGAAMPHAGAPYNYIHRALGPQAAMLTAFAMLISNFSALAFITFVLGEFLVRLGVGSGAYSPLQLALGSLVMLGAVNATGTRLSGASQILLSAVKGAVLLGLVVALFASPGTDAQRGGEVLHDGLLPLGTAFVVIITTYAGWQNMSTFGEEIRDPGRAIPRALFGGILGVSFIYITVNIAMLHVLTPEQMAGSNLVAADAARVVFGPGGDFFITTFGLLSVGAISNLSIMTYSRTTYALSRAGMLPRFLMKVGKNGTPYRALVTTVLIAGILMTSGSYLELISMGETVFIPVLIGVAVSIIVLRWREPDLVRPYKVPLYPWLTILSILVLTAMLVIYIAQDPEHALRGFVLVGALWVLYQVGARLRGQKGFVAADLEMH